MAQTKYNTGTPEGEPPFISGTYLPPDQDKETPTYTVAEIAKAAAVRLMTEMLKHRQLTNIWEDRITTEMPFRIQDFQLLSSFDKQEVQALNLYPQRVIKAFGKYKQANSIIIGDGTGEFTIEDAIYAFRLDAFDSQIIAAGSALQGAYTALSDTSNQVIISASFGDQEARERMEIALGDQFSSQYKAFVSVSDTFIERNTVSLGVTLDAPIDLKEKTMEVNMDALIEELERLLAALEQEFRILQRLTDKNTIMKGIKATVARIRVFSVVHHKADILAHPTFIKALQALGSSEKTEQTNPDHTVPLVA